MREKIYIHLFFFYSQLLFYIHSNTLIFQIFRQKLLIVFDKWNTQFCVLLLKIMLLELVLGFSIQAAAKTYSFFHFVISQWHFK